MHTFLRARRRLLALLACLMLLPSAAPAQTASERVFLLVAAPGMPDGNFSGTVVLAMRPDEGGLLGIILNRPTDMLLRELYPEREEFADRDDLLFLGGPVDTDALLFAFRTEVPPLEGKGFLVAENIYVSGFSGMLDELLRHPENMAEQRFFVGYSGWADGQLEAEIARGGWLTLPFDVDVLFRMNPFTMYDELLRRAMVPRYDARLPTPALTASR